MDRAAARGIRIPSAGSGAPAHQLGTNSTSAHLCQGPHVAVGGVVLQRGRVGGKESRDTQRGVVEAGTSGGGSGGTSGRRPERCRARAIARAAAPELRQAVCERHRAHPSGLVLPPPSPSRTYDDRDLGHFIGLLSGGGGLGGRGGSGLGGGLGGGSGLCRGSWLCGAEAAESVASTTTHENNEWAWPAPSRL